MTLLGTLVDITIHLHDTNCLCREHHVGGSFVIDECLQIQSMKGPTICHVITAI